jgi:hypothetical protein
VRTGEVVFRKECAGNYLSESLKTSECTTAYYSAFEQASMTFISQPDLARAMEVAAASK